MQLFEKEEKMTCLKKKRTRTNINNFKNMNKLYSQKNYAKTISLNCDIKKQWVSKKDNGCHREMLAPE